MRLLPSMCVLCAICATHVQAFDQNESLNRTHWREQQRPNINRYPYGLPTIPSIHGDLRRTTGELAPAYVRPGWLPELTLSYRLGYDVHESNSLAIKSPFDPNQDPEAPGAKGHSRQRHDINIKYRQATPSGIGVEFDWGGSLIHAERVDPSTDPINQREFTISDLSSRVTWPLYTTRYSAIALTTGLSTGLAQDAKDASVAHRGLTPMLGLRGSAAWGYVVFHGQGEVKWTPKGHTSCIRGDGADTFWDDLRNVWTSPEQREELYSLQGDVQDYMDEIPVEYRAVTAAGSVTWRPASWVRLGGIGRFSFEEWLPDVDDVKRSANKVDADYGTSLYDEINLSPWDKISATVGPFVEFTPVAGWHIQLEGGTDILARHSTGVPMNHTWYGRGSMVFEF